MHRSTLLASGLQSITLTVGSGKGNVSMTDEGPTTPPPPNHFNIYLNQIQSPETRNR